MRRKSGDLDSIANSLEKTLKKLGIKRELQIQRLNLAWAKAAGPAIASRSGVANFFRNVLYINFEDPAWLSEAEFNKEQLLKKVKKAAAGEKIRGLKFGIGPFPANERRMIAAASRTDIPEDDNPEEPDDLTLARIEKITSECRDPHLRERLKKLLLRSMMSKKRINPRR